MNDDNIVLSYPLMARQREDKIKSNLVAYAEDVNAELDHMVDVHNQLVMMLNGEWSEDTGRIYQLMNQAITTANEAKAIADNCVKRSGDTMTGHLNSSLTPTSDYNLVNKAYVDDKVNTEVGSVEARVELLEDFAENLEADQVKLDNTNFSSTNVHDGFSELFISVSNGKAIVAAAITGKGVETAADASFKTMADNINAILTFTEGTRGGTATNADIVYGKTAYARGQLLVGTLDLSNAYNTSDATATPYDIVMGKVAYGNTGRMVGLLNMGGDKPSYDIGSVRKIYGYSDSYVSNDTKFDDTTTIATAFGVNNLTGEVVCKVSCKGNDDGTVSIITQKVSRSSSGGFIYANKKEHILQSSNPIPFNQYGNNVRDIQISDCSDEDNIYLYMVVYDDRQEPTLIVIKLKENGVEIEGGTKYEWDLDTSKVYILPKFITYSGSSYSYYTRFKIVISNEAERASRDAVIVALSSNKNAIIFTVRLVDNADGSISVIKLSEASASTYIVGSSAYGAYCHGYFGYSDRFCMIVGATPIVIWLTSAFTIQSVETAVYKSISPDGSMLIYERNIYDFSNRIKATTGTPSLDEDGLDKIGTIPFGSAIGLGNGTTLNPSWKWFSPSSNMLIVVYQSTNQSTGNGPIYFGVCSINKSSAPSAVTNCKVLAEEFTIKGKLDYEHQVMSNSNTMLMIYGSPVSNLDCIINMERDYNVVIGLEYEGDIYYKAGYDGSLVVGGDR